MKSDAGFAYMFGAAWALAGIVCMLAGLLVIRLAEEPDAVHQRLLWLAPALGFAFLVGGVRIVLRGRTMAARDKRLATNGIRLKATVTDVRRTWLAINNEFRWRVHYSYDYPTGRAQTGRSPLLRPKEANRSRVGDIVDVMVDPRAPHESLLVLRS